MSLRVNRVRNPLQPADDGNIGCEPAAKSGRTWGNNSLLAGGSQHHYRLALHDSLQFMQQNFCGIWN